MTHRTLLSLADPSARSTQLWSSDAWRWEVTRWIDEVLARRGITRVPTSPRQPRLRPWSTQLVVETDHGRAWFKASVPESAPEPAVHRLLGEVAPDLLPTLWASDDEQRWTIGPDQGQLLRGVARPDTIVSLWSGVLRRYARLQRASATVADRLVAAGVPRRTPHDLVDAWQERAGVDAVSVPMLRAAADRLTEVDLPITVEHGDLHAGNVFCAHGSAAAVHDARFFDWGDAYLGNPLGSLLIALRGPSYHFGLPEDPERDARLMRAYLTGWSDLVPTQTLEPLVPDALLLARVARLLSWDDALARATDNERAEWQHQIDQWVDEIGALAG
ncbi:phosphotransferase [Luteipulveratus halotolerans]|uniref:Aminoglycoside phosphotransferase domain-containing protein n=1 Tax=Luteipulveratus halotolerans TaxID=1631356 RepID=A0A0L6CGT2_9MICO|nr:phosphotransferase [Luteipulveratus halotolerans]KNX37007.1 hypothetical protein VV01_07375 [Luteipulveratus halotolerans]